MHSRLFHALGAFYIWESLEEQIASNIVGKDKSRANVEVMNRFNSFFVISKQALHVYWLIELAKLFDDMGQSLHVTKLINFAEGNRGKLSKQEFFRLNKDRRFASELYEKYQGLSQEDLSGLRTKLKKHIGIIKRLDTHRDQCLAHDDIKKSKISLTRKEVITLFDLVKVVLNLFSQRLDFSSTSYKHVEADCKADTQRLTEYLRGYEKYKFNEELEEKN